jgi:hypothetical protein
LGSAAVRNDAAGNVEVYLQLQPNESIILRALARRSIAGPPWTYLRPRGQPVAIGGAWQVKFVDGGPVLPAAYGVTRLASWTARGDAEAERFAGTARYTIAFDAPAAPADAWLLDLGSVCHSARVRLNGRELGTLFMAPYRLRVDRLQPRGNRLEVEVTNLSANRIRDLDRRHVPWRTFYDINFVGINYRPFDASGWPVRDSGLLGPVQLRPAATWPVTSAGR